MRVRIFYAHPGNVHTCHTFAVPVHGVPRSTARLSTLGNREKHMVVSALLAQTHFLQSIEKALEGSLLRRLKRINLCYHNTTGECAMLCQSVPTLRWDHKIFQS